MNLQEPQAVSAGRTRERGNVPARGLSSLLEKSHPYFYFTCSEAMARILFKRRIRPQRGNVPALFPRFDHAERPNCRNSVTTTKDHQCLFD